MEDIGQKLREAREAKGLSIAEIEEKTKIQRRYLVAIEEGEFDKLPGDFYVRAFIKQYAEVVGLNGNELLSDFHQTVPMPQPEEYVENSNENKAQRVRRTTNNKKGIWKNYIPHVAAVIGVILVLGIVYLVYANVFAKPNQTSAPAPDKIIVNSKIESSSSKKSSSKKEKPATKKEPESKVKFTKDTEPTALPNTYKIENLPKEAKIEVSTGDVEVWSDVSFDGTQAWQGTIPVNSTQVVDVTPNAKEIRLNLGNTSNVKVKIGGQKFELPQTANPGAPQLLHFNVVDKTASEDVKEGDQ